MKRIITLLLAVAAISVAAPDAAAQSFKERLKQAAEKARSKVKEEVSKITSGVTSGGTSSSASSSSGTSGGSVDISSASGVFYTKSVNGNETVSLPDSHTALFAPLGKAVNAKYGTKSVKPVKPPKDETKQPDYLDKLPDIRTFDNQSLFDECDMLYKLMFEENYLDPTGPCCFRWSALKDEIEVRRKALEGLVEKYLECKYAYAEGDKAWIDSDNRALARILEGDAYRVVIRSSIMPYFRGDDRNPWYDEYFKIHGGYENAHKAKFTVWNPDAK